MQQQEQPFIKTTTITIRDKDAKVHQDRVQDYLCMYPAKFFNTTIASQTYDAVQNTHVTKLTREVKE